MNPLRVKTGERVRVLDVPQVRCEPHDDTQRVFQRCVGHIYTVRGVSQHGDLELHFSADGTEMHQRGPGLNQIWIGPEYVEIAASTG